MTEMSNVEGLMVAHG